jgi:hypothetical protein
MSITSMAVDAETLAQVADLVGEDHLDGMPGIARVLDHLGDADGGTEERRVDVLIQRLCRRGVGGVVVSHQRQRWVAEVADRRALAQELGVHGDTEPVPVFLARGGFEHWNDGAVRRAGEHGAADDDHVVVVLVAKHLADLVAHASEIGEVKASVLAAWGADADQREIRRSDRILGACGGPQTALIHPALKQIRQAGLDDRAAAFVDGVDLVRTTSTPTTSCPSLANAAAETLPTYPRPNTETLMFVDP